MMTMMNEKDTARRIRRDNLLSISKRYDKGWMDGGEIAAAYTTNMDDDKLEGIKLSHS